MTLTRKPHRDGKALRRLGGIEEVEERILFDRWIEIRFAGREKETFTAGNDPLIGQRLETPEPPLQGFPTIVPLIRREQFQFIGPAAKSESGVESHAFQ